MSVAVLKLALKLPSASFFASLLIWVIGFDNFLDIKYPTQRETISTTIVVKTNWLLKILIVESSGSNETLIKA